MLRACCNMLSRSNVIVIAESGVLYVRIKHKAERAEELYWSCDHT